MTRIKNNQRKEVSIVHVVAAEEGVEVPPMKTSHLQHSDQGARASVLDQRA
jgi:uracil phosphoribosyltransferase